MNSAQAAAVEALLRETAAEIILPRFRRLQSHDVSEKAPGDYVTVVDTEAERALTAGLAAILPGSIVIGEEAVAKQATDLTPLQGDAPVWLVDPLDGTGNFVQGKACFASMVALVQQGRLIAGWIHDPVSGWMAQAEAGAGAWRDGHRLELPNDRRPPNRLRANKRLIRRLGEAGAAAFEPFNYRCAGQEYVALGIGEADLALYSRLFPWDHAAGLLLHREAGGVGRLIDGSAYDVTATSGLLLLAPDDAIWERTADLLRAV